MCSQLPSTVYRHTVRIRPLVYKVRLTHNTLAHTHRRTHSRFKFVPFARINCRNFLTSERVPKPCATARRVVASSLLQESLPILWRSKHHRHHHSTSTFHYAFLLDNVRLRSFVFWVFHAGASVCLRARITTKCLASHLGP